MPARASGALARGVRRSDFIRLSFGTNAAAGALKLALGLAGLSPLVLLNAAYNGVLAAARLAMLGHRRAIDADAASEAGARRLQRTSSVALMALGCTFVAFNGLMLAQDRALSFDYNVALGFATCAFAKLGVAVYGIVRERKNPDGVVFACKLTNLADGMASIAITQAALLDITDSQNVLASGCFGAATGAAILGIGLWLRVRARRGAAGPRASAAPPRTRCRRPGR